jgi:hypothetical protein
MSQDDYFVNKIVVVCYRIFLTKFRMHDREKPVKTEKIDDDDNDDGDDDDDNNNIIIIIITIKLPIPVAARCKA